MADWFTVSKRIPRTLAPQTILRIASAVLVSTSLWAVPSLAKDPFRTTEARPISDRTEKAFQALFAQGNYRAAEDYLKQGDSNDPLSYALKASLAYMNIQGEKDKQAKSTKLSIFKAYTDQTRGAAERMLGSDPLRGNLYLAVSHFLDSAYVFSTEGTVKGTPKVLGEVRQAFKYLDEAESKSPNDPELNLIKGYMDLFMALNLPFSSPSKAIERLEKYASPRYLADRGIALGYRDLNQPTKALEAVDRALQATPDNPELLYLKAQILVRQGNNRDSIQFFEKALTKKEQLPNGLVKQISRELRGAQKRMGNVGQ